MRTMEKSKTLGLSALSNHGGGAYTVYDDESILLDPIAVAESGDVFDDCGTSYDLWIGWRPDPVASIYRDDDGSWISVLSLRDPVDRALAPLIRSDLESAIVDTVNSVVEHDGDRDAYITKIANEVATELTKKCGMEFEVFAERLGLDTEATKFKFYIVFSGDFRKLVGSLRNELPGTIQGLFSKAGFDETFTFSLTPSIEWMIPDVFRKARHNKPRVIVDADELIDAASTLIEDANPTQAKLRRGMSTLYYALFHRLASSNADVLVGDPAQNPAEWERIYRALDHGSIRKLQNNNKREFSSNMKGFIERICELQTARTEADYSPLEGVTKYTASWSVVSASRAVELFNQATKSEKLALAVHLLIGERKVSSERPPDVAHWQRDRDEFMASL